MTARKPDGTIPFDQFARAQRIAYGRTWIAWADAMGVALSTAQAWEAGKIPRHPEALVMKMEAVVKAKVRAETEGCL